MCNQVEGQENNTETKKNVLIISLSTLPTVMEENYYYFDDKNNNRMWYRGTYSMEPGTKHVLNVLSKEGKKLDKIIMLSTKEAKSAVEFYKDKVDKFIKNGDELELKDIKKIQGLIDADNNKINDFKPEIKEKYEVEFVEIELGNVEVLSYEKMPAIVNEILSIKGNGVDLYLDMQGGARVSTFIINAAVNMLQGEGISLAHSYAILYNRNNRVHRLRDETTSNHIFDMVSGMDEFLNYGRAKKFKEYFTYYKDNYKNGETLAEDKLVNKIYDISDAISICNIKGFYDGLDELDNLIGEYNKLEEKEKDPIFQAFVQKIEKTYAGILSENRRAIDVMEWCLNKEWYQQALTICESKMPEQMIKDNVVYYDDNCFLKFNKYKNTNKKCPETEDSALFVVKYYEHNYNKKVRIKSPKKNEDWFDRMKEKKNRESSLFELIKEGELFSTFYYKDDKEQTNDQLLYVFILYFGLARVRNQVNHVGKPVELNKLKEFMREFVNEYKALLKKTSNNEDTTKKANFSMDEIKTGVRKII